MQRATKKKKKKKREKEKMNNSEIEKTNMFTVVTDDSSEWACNKVGEVVDVDVVIAFASPFRIANFVAL